MCRITENPAVISMVPGNAVPGDTPMKALLRRFFPVADHC